MPLHPDPRFNAFFLLTGGSFAAFAVSFTPCMFDIDTVDACADVATHWVGIFQQVGDHIIAWAFALFHAIMSRS